MLIATSNISPNDLYYGGLNRIIFEPFIPLLLRHVKAVDMSGMMDYRHVADMAAATSKPSNGELVSETAKLYYYPINSDTERSIESIWNSLCDDVPCSVELPVAMGRKIKVSLACRMNQSFDHESLSMMEIKNIRDELLKSDVRMCRFQFNELCEVALGSADYFSIAEHFSVCFITGIPEFGYDNRNSMRRFITLIDCLYENKIIIYCTASDKPEKLLKIDCGSNSSAKNNILQEFSEKNCTANYYQTKGESVKMSVSNKGGSSGRLSTSIGGTEWSATGLMHVSLADLDPRKFEDEILAFRRASSRLKEMQLSSYILSSYAKILDRQKREINKI